MSLDFAHLKITSSKLTKITFSFCHLQMFVFLRYLPEGSTLSFTPEFVSSTKNTLGSPMVKAQVF